MDDERLGKFAVTTAGGARLVRLPPGFAAGQWRITFVLDGAGAAVGKRHDPWHGIPELLQCQGPLGPITLFPTAGGHDGQVAYVEYQFEVGIPWLRVSCRTADGTVASEEVTLG